MSTFEASKAKAIKQAWAKLLPVQQAEAWDLMMSQIITSQFVELSFEHAADRIRDLRLLTKPVQRHAA
ncbi:MAG TPA: hypothetical protein VHU15_09200 [Stellaceae bacterium]|jgi:hypothetical protein|nr:hypothetical protein [Stellaceae bacterium]